MGLTDVCACLGGGWWCRGNLDGRWARLRDYPTPIADNAMCVAYNAVYSFGGDVGPQSC